MLLRKNKPVEKRILRRSKIAKKPCKTKLESLSTGDIVLQNELSFLRTVRVIRHEDVDMIAFITGRIKAYVIITVRNKRMFDVLEQIVLRYVK